jgi:ABC-type transport system, involved in lipoprotein release, permease component
MKIARLAVANIRNGKSAALSQLVLIFIAALLLTTGMTVIGQIGSFFDRKTDQLRDPHAVMIIEEAQFKPEYEQFVRSYPGVASAEAEPILLLNGTNFLFNHSNMSIGTVILNAEKERSLSPLNLIETSKTATAEDIYLSYSFKVSGGYKLGDSFTFHYKEKDYRFRVAGFFETTMMGSQSMGSFKFYLADAAYRNLADSLGESSGGRLLSATLADRYEGAALLSDFKRAFPEMDSPNNSDYTWQIDVGTVKSTSTMTVNIVAMLLIAFASVIVLVCLIVIKFRVSNSIKDGMRNIGILQAIGYTNGQILFAFVLQFAGIAFVGSVAGVAASHAAMPFFGGVISSLSGLRWSGSFDLAVQFGSLFLVVALVLAVTLQSSLRIRKLAPVAALRGGIATHSFRRNYFPLERSKGGLDYVLALKAMMAGRKHNAMIALIMAAVTFGSIFSIILYYNVAKDKTAFIHLVGVETSNVLVTANSGENGQRLRASLEKEDGVDKVTVLDLVETRMEGETVYTNLSDDFGRLENNTAYEGRHPKYDNEISISWLIAKKWDKRIGDTIQVEAGGRTYSYLVTGFSQEINNMGQVANLTLNGMRHLIPDYQATSLHVYLEGKSNKPFISDIKEKYGDTIRDVIDVDETLKSQTGTYVSAVFAIMVVVLTSTVLVMALILYLVIQTTILKRKQEFGIQKALGFSALQLMNQIAISFVPVAVAGVFIGCLLGCLCTNPLLALLFSSTGIKSVQFVVNVPIIASVGVVIVVLAYIISLLVSRRVRHLSAYSLIVE